MRPTHEVRDALYGFVRYSTDERRLIDSEPFQRLRDVHQLALTALVYPGATHKRFEHSLGVMELASRVFHVITAQENLLGLPRELLDHIPHDNLPYWETVLRLAALCHDLGHLPFSHAAEKEILPKGITHERISWDLVLHENMRPLWESVHVTPMHVAKIAVGKKDAPKEERFTTWETLVAEIIVGDVFGADRMDYLLRDALHLGVAYGRFDYKRLINTLRILPKYQEGEEREEQSLEPTIGVELGGLQAAESLLMARYLMFAQVYCHHVRRVYDLHLQQFMRAWLNGETYPTNYENFLEISDSNILLAMRKTVRNPELPGHEPARRIIRRDHFKKAYQVSTEERQRDLGILDNLEIHLGDTMGKENVLVDRYRKPTVPGDFPVRMNGNKCVSAMQQSTLLKNLPAAETGYVFVPSEHKQQAQKMVDTYQRNR
jgi:uncharacterized protein